MRPTYDQLAAQNAQLKVENAQLVVQNAQLVAENAQLKAEIVELKALVKSLMNRVAELEDQINKNSKNSSKPSSTDRKPNYRTKLHDRRSFPYHPGANRQLLPESAVTSSEIRYIDVCPRCRSQMEPTGQVSSWQQIELPVIKPLVHQIDLAHCKCPRCHLETKAELAEAEQFLLGPRLEAFVNLLLGQYRQGHLAVRTIIATILPGIELSQGLISKIKSRTAKILSGPHEAILEAIRSSTDPVYVDATGWRHKGVNEHLLVLRVKNIVGYTIVRHQNSATIARTLGGRVEHLVVDRGLAVGQVELKTKQYCLAHLMRNIQGLAEHPQVSYGDTDRLGRIYDRLQELFIDKHRAAIGEISLSSWRQYGYRKWNMIVEELEFLENAGSTKKLRKFCTKLLKQLLHFRTYLKNPEFPMTNNLAEEALRNLVIARKLCFGSRSEYGKRWRESLHSCIETLKRQGQSILDFLAETIQQARTGACHCTLSKEERLAAS